MDSLFHRFKKLGQNDDVPSEEGGIETSPNRADQGKVLLSGRNDFLKNVEGQYERANVSQKVLGMGRGGNYEETPKLIEMDFIDWFFNFGLLQF